MTVLLYMILLLCAVFFLIGVFVPLLRKLIDRGVDGEINEIITLKGNIPEKSIKNV